MIFTPTPIEGVFVISPEARSDERGFFARIFCAEEFAKYGLNSQWVQMNNSFTTQKGTIRGLHFQRAPSAEVKLVRCIRGIVWDVVVDLRSDSPTFGKWYAAELSAENRAMMYVPEGVAHGFQSLTDDSELLYMVSAAYSPMCEGGLRFDDPTVGITWPLSVSVLSDRDRNLPLFHAIE